MDPQGVAAPTLKTTALEYYRITFTVASETYSIERGNKSSGSDSWTTDEAVRDLGDSSGSHYYPGIDIFSVSTNPVVFKPTGTMTATTVTLQNSKSETASIKSTIAGQIKVQ